ncbi:MAG: hypothetical protein FJ297_00650 [Planctomycetes bacterium]|nr:hypothetical protein [Planctomycetota bacterium]
MMSRRTLVFATLFGIVIAVAPEIAEAGGFGRCGRRPLFPRRALRAACSPCDPCGPCSAAPPCACESGSTKGAASKHPCDGKLCLEVFIAEFVDIDGNCLYKTYGGTRCLHGPATYDAACEDVFTLPQGTCENAQTCLHCLDVGSLAQVASAEKGAQGLHHCKKALVDSGIPKRAVSIKPKNGAQVEDVGVIPIELKPGQVRSFHLYWIRTRGGFTFGAALDADNDAPMPTLPPLSFQRVGKTGIEIRTAAPNQSRVYFGFVR